MHSQQAHSTTTRRLSLHEFIVLRSLGPLRYLRDDESPLWKVGRSWTYLPARRRAATQACETLTTRGLVRKESGHCSPQYGAMSAYVLTDAGKALLAQVNAITHRSQPNIRAESGFARIRRLLGGPHDTAGGNSCSTVMMANY
ncbi:hypothetical protein [Pseudomonas nitroreducens]|uniref:hypothetical protein n=1 Tax=Pseudomonas nitroreducens TaxID=46680 RepID=UPI00351D7D1C